MQRRAFLGVSFQTGALAAAQAAAAQTLAWAAPEETARHEDYPQRHRGAADRADGHRTQGGRRGVDDYSRTTRASSRPGASERLLPGDLHHRPGLSGAGDLPDGARQRDSDDRRRRACVCAVSLQGRRSGVRLLRDLRENIRKFEATGVSPFAIRSAITDAVDFHESVGVDRKAARLRYLRQYWMRRVAGLPGVKLLNVDDPRMSCGLGAMTLAGWDSTALTAYLMREHRIHVRAREVVGEFHCIRVTPNIYSTIEELETFCAAIEAASRNRMPMA